MSRTARFEARTGIPSVGSVMTRAPVAVTLDTSVRAAEDMMIDHEVRHLPVLEHGRLVGIVSDRDVAFSSNAPDPELADRLRVRDVCSLDVYAVAPGERLDVVLLEMAERRLGSTLVVEEGVVLGIFTATDACRCFAELLRARLSPD